MLHNRLLTYLDTVARVGSIRQAAIRLNVAAPAINRHILALEQEFGGPLFERMPRGLKPTPLGNLVIAHVRETLRGFDALQGSIASLRDMTRGEVTLVTMTGFVSGLLADALVTFRAQYPLVRLIHRTGDGEIIIRMVASGEADIGIGYNLPDHPQLRRSAEFDYHLGAVVAPNHSLTRQASVLPEDCLAFPMVLAERSMTLRQVASFLVPPTTDLAAAIETDSVHLMKSLAKRAPYVAFMNYADVAPELADGSLVFLPLNVRGDRQTLSIVHRASHPSDPTLRLALETIQTVFACKVGRERLGEGQTSI
ncbi:LysR family transcriptional regulator [Komagataeibacter sp. FNDCF1]|uniref:LysR family transcriptional regulator n=1 Tax=Komagataeibacter sp. FNDCF1 TaxID=2878681 RepID=UPI001E5E2EA8|nr:LysR family transcriptional regulator [Komagataeibacter sp. FNDCF1]MCE2564820.1 LysR family transcriptional regulator [Komagataeibacter sp. FNDCF1]